MEGEDDSRSVVVAKVVAMCTLFVASMVLGLVPLKLSQWFHWKAAAKNNTYVQLMLCAGGGVLLCTTFVHLLPEVAAHSADLEEFPEDLPVAQLLMCAGFFTMYLVEECVHAYIHANSGETHGSMKAVRRSISLSRGQFDAAATTRGDVGLVTELPTPNREDHHHIDHSHADHSHLVMQNSTVITLRGLLVVLALSVHELFEGLAVGLETSAGHVWYMFGAVAAHKLVIAFCVGVELVTSGMRRALVAVYVFAFAVVSPVGIGVGIAVTEEHHRSTTLMSVILQGLASGTLLYVVFFEILNEERKRGLKQYFAVLGGFLVMFALSFVGGHEHSQDDHDHDH